MQLIQRSKSQPLHLNLFTFLVCPNPVIPEKHPPGNFLPSQLQPKPKSPEGPVPR